MIIEVSEITVLSAAEIHAESWKESHRELCSKEFIEQYTVDRQKTYLQNEMKEGKHLYMLVEHKPVGIVSVKENLIENLYILPSEQHKGYGTKLLQFALKHCIGTPYLWILDNNQKAYSLYLKHGFQLTGNKNELSNTISEIEMKYKPSSK